MQMPSDDENGIMLDYFNFRLRHVEILTREKLPDNGEVWLKHIV
jgi:hypothetical protein